MRYFVFISDQKSSCCFCAFHNSEWISFCNHRNRKVVGGKHNVLVPHYVNVSAPTHLVLLSATLSNEIFCGWKLCNFLHACHKSEIISFLNHRNRMKSGFCSHYFLLSRQTKVVSVIKDCSKQLMRLWAIALTLANSNGLLLHLYIWVVKVSFVRHWDACQLTLVCRVLLGLLYCTPSIWSVC